ncbi:hypothetical protein M409DRAFT_58971 [Zasmidium cellare ATCC 36951]|uniref:Uncharacterized protein n=1 Tax=Zasmidium cellare ATCC 36951 TaxID=1080233 RepID=A0A6A6C3S0_ZASCE|nr:uncharacterized protein M409DRAFT_58971 [Zasmidium cellare ATCC 36951]KAF2161573.1 hypothetical protein M409DRAFT_58971 [Zasmidium cellare ATCC 36951]
MAILGSRLCMLGVLSCEAKRRLEGCKKRVSKAAAASPAASASALAATCEICTSSASTGLVLLDRCLHEPTRAAATPGTEKGVLSTGVQRGINVARLPLQQGVFAWQGRRPHQSAKNCGRQMTFQILAARCSRRGGLILLQTPPVFHYFWAEGSSQRAPHRRQSHSEHTNAHRHLTTARQLQENLRTATSVLVNLFRALGVVGLPWLSQTACRMRDTASEFLRHEVVGMSVCRDTAYQRRMLTGASGGRAVIGSSKHDDMHACESGIPPPSRAWAVAKMFDNASSAVDRGYSGQQPFLSPNRLGGAATLRAKNDLDFTEQKKTNLELATVQATQGTAQDKDGACSRRVWWRPVKRANWRWM